MKEKTLNEKMMTPYEAVRKFEEEWDNNNPELKCVLDSEDVRQFIKEILDEIDKWKIRDYPKNSQKDIGWNNAILNVIDFIKQKAGFEELE